MIVCIVIPCACHVMCFVELESPLEVCGLPTMPNDRAVQTDDHLAHGVRIQMSRSTVYSSCHESSELSVSKLTTNNSITLSGVVPFIALHSAGINAIHHNSPEHTSSADAGRRAAWLHDIKYCCCAASRRTDHVPLLGRVGDRFLRLTSTTRCAVAVGSERRPSRGGRCRRACQLQPRMCKRLVLSILLPQRSLSDGLERGIDTSTWLEHGYVVPPAGWATPTPRHVTCDGSRLGPGRSEDVTVSQSAREMSGRRPRRVSVATWPLRLMATAWSVSALTAPVSHGWAVG